MLLGLGLLALHAAEPDPRLVQARDDPGATIRLLGELSAEVARAVPSDAAELGDRLDPLCRRLALEGWRVPGRDAAGLASRVVAPGDSLSRIARANASTVDLLLRLNPGCDPRRLAPGQQLTVLDARSVPLRIEVDRGTRHLRVWRGPLMLLSTQVGVGAGGTPTPAGTTKLAQRVRDPEWRDPATGKVHPPHSPGNLLGGWWLGFEPGADQRFRSIGCHGWTGADPQDWVGQAGSRGCIRLRQADLADLAALVVPGVAVEVR